MEIKKVVTGEELQEILSQIDRVYFEEYVTRCATKPNLTIVEEGLKIQWNKYTSSLFPINKKEKYINYAVAGEIGDLKKEYGTDLDDIYEEWDNHKYFDYVIYIDDALISFNTTQKSKYLTNEQFKSLIKEGHNCYDAMMVDSGAIFFDFHDCQVNVEDAKIFINEIEIDMDIVESIENFTEESEDVSFIINFNNGSPALEIQPSYNMRAFMSV